MDFQDSDSEVDLSNDFDDDRAVLKKTRQSIGLSRDYVPNWDSRDAFREFYQNWMDGMIEAHKVAREDIEIVIKDAFGEWVATAHRPISNEMLGFIRFDKIKGILELTNFNILLTRKALDIGATSKRAAAGQAGTHGEGFKVASLVMVRKGFQVRYESARYYWTFQFGGRDKLHLYCHLSPMSDNKIIRLMTEEHTRKLMGKPRGFKGYICEDVTVKMGKVYGSGGNKIEFEKFQNWIKVSFALNRPSRLLKTPDGDLVLTKDFGGRMYLKGLYLSCVSGTKDLKFGYNIHQGSVNRDRQQLSDSRQEASTLAKIWAQSIKQGGSEVLKEYTKMLREDDTKQWADVNLSCEKMTRETATSVWRYIVEEDISHLKFFYNKKTEAEDVNTISKCLKKQPVSLPNSLWEPLRRFALVRTPEEQRHHKLFNAQSSELEHTSYSKAIKRSLRAILSLDDRTKDLDIIFKSGADADLDLLLQDSNLLINDKWLDFERSHVKAPCWLSRYGVIRHDMPCDHVITRLYDIILRELTKGKVGYFESSVDSKDILRLKVGDNLRQMPRMIEIVRGDNAGELAITWTILEKDLIFKLYGVDLRCRVTLHRESTCSDKKTDILSCIETCDSAEIDGHPELNDNTTKCGCPFQIVSHEDSGAAFRGLNFEEEYFPMVARDYDQAFFGVPPQCIRPAPPSHSLGATPQPTTKVEVTSVSQRGKRMLTPPGSWRRDVLSEDNSFGSDSGDMGLEYEKDSESSIVDDENSSKKTAEVKPAAAEQAIKNEAQGPQTTKTLSSSLMTAVAKMKSQEKALHLTSNKLQLAEGKLNDTMSSLENVELELRQAKADNDAQKQRFESTIEDLEGEIRRLEETQSESETKCVELSNIVQNLQNERQQLQERNTEVESRVEQPLNIDQSDEVAEMKEQFLELQSSLQKLKQRDNQTRQLEAANEALKSQVNQARADHASIMTTLEGVSGMIQGVLSLGSRAMMITTLQSVLGMLQGVLSLGARKLNQPTGTKHARVKEEDDDDDAFANGPKRLRQVEHIDLTS